MHSAWFEFIIISLLIFLNGFFAMSEIAIISARKSFLYNRAQNGNKSARTALELRNNPNNFLPSIQVGITTVGILMGVFGGTTIAFHIRNYLQKIPFTSQNADILSLTIVVILISYLTLIFGELVPKRLALNDANGISLLTAKPVNYFSIFTTPFVRLLAFSTDLILFIFRIKINPAPSITEEEISYTIELGKRAGLVEADEQKMVTRIFEFGDRQAHSIMTPRTDVSWFNISEPLSSLFDVIAKAPYSYYPAIKNQDQVIGVISTKEFLQKTCTCPSCELKDVLQLPLYIPEHTPVLNVLERFRRAPVHFAIVLDEYGGFSGIITPSDILQAIVGELPLRSGTQVPAINKLKDDYWEIDGALPIQEFKVFFQIDELPEDQYYSTISGFVLMVFGYIPEAGESFQWNSFEFKIAVVKNHRIHKIIVHLRK